MVAMVSYPHSQSRTEDYYVATNVSIKVKVELYSMTFNDN